MKKSTLSYVIIIVIALAAIVAVYWVNYRDQSSNDIISIKATGGNTNANISANGPFLMYSQREAGSNRVKVVRDSISANSKNTIFTFTNEFEGSSPLYYKYGDNALFIMRAGGEDTNVIIDKTGALLTDAYQPISTEFLLSPSGKYLAMNRWEQDTKNGYTFVIRDIVNNTEQTIPTGKYGEQIPIIYLPIIWSEDERYVYVDQGIETEGWPVGLLKINRETMGVERVAAVDTENAVMLEVDQKLRAYGVDNNDVAPFESVWAKEIIEINIANGVTTKHPLLATSVSNTWSVNDAGTYLAYACPFTANSHDLCLLNLSTNEETRLTTDKVVDGPVVWQGDKVAYTEQPSDSNINGTRSVIYVYDAQTKQVVHTIPAGQSEQLIGWFE